MQRRTLALFVLAAMLVSSLVTWYASARIRSPAEVAAQTAPPEPSPILVPVQERVLSTKVVSRGTAKYGSPQDLRVTRSGLKRGQRLVTTTPSAGTELYEGSVVLTISGRPVFLLTGAEPAYRDLGPGMCGEDVRQLEKALRRAGYDPGRADGVFDDATGRALDRLYARHGSYPVRATDGQLARLRPVESSLIPCARAGGGIQLPADEVIFVPQTPPLQVIQAAARVGAPPPSGALVTVASSLVAVTGTFPVDSARLVKEGAEAQIDEPALGITATGRVSSIADRPGTDGADGFHVAFEVVVSKPPAALVGASVRVTVAVRSTRRAELVVPVSAVSLGADGSSRVQRSVGGRLDFVTVQPGLSADGLVAITPQGQLSAGDMVVVGFENGTGERSGG
jgi:peptidoglycan hydrolase-like protein with peptidoglycan-binding domain